MKWDRWDYRRGQMEGRDLRLWPRRVVWLAYLLTPIHSHSCCGWMAKVLYSVRTPLYRFANLERPGLGDEDMSAEFEVAVVV